MGASSSKASRAAGAAARKYPTRTPPTSQATTNAPPRAAPPVPDGGPGPTTRPQPQASASRSQAINLDASDPDFARSLRSIGPVQPNPTFSQTSTFPGPSNPNAAAPRYVGPDPKKHPSLAVLEARSRFQDEAEKEFMDAGRRGHPGRQFLDVYTIRQMLVLRDESGKSAAQIEKALGLKQGTVDRLGPVGVAGLVQEVGRARKEIDIV